MFVTYIKKKKKKETSAVTVSVEINGQIFVSVSIFNNMGKYKTTVVWTNINPL